MIGDWLRSAGKAADKVENFVEEGQNFVEDAAQSFGDAGRDFHRSWVYDDSPAISGEAKTIHPFQFAQFTGAKWIGVTRLPQTTIRVGSKIRQWKKALQKSQTKKSVSSSRGKRIRTGTGKTIVKRNLKRRIALATMQGMTKANRLKKRWKLGIPTAGWITSRTLDQSGILTTTSPSMSGGTNDWFPKSKEEEDRKWLA